MGANHRLLDLGRIRIPAFVSREVASFVVPSEDSIAAVRIGKRPSRKSLGQSISSAVKAWAESVASEFGATKIADATECMIFGNVYEHNDGNEWLLDGQRFVFLHVVVSGRATLCFPGVKDASRRTVEMRKGRVFAFDPRVNHAVVDAQRFGVRTIGLAVALDNKAA